MSSADKVDFLRKFIELTATGKDDIWGPMLAEDVEFIRPFLPPGMPKTIKGRSEWVSFVRDAFKVIKEFRWLDLDLHGTDEPDVVYGTSKSRVDLLDGRFYENEYVYIVKFGDGLIKKYTEYLDPLEVLKAFDKELAEGVWDAPKPS